MPVSIPPITRRIAAVSFAGIAGAILAGCPVAALDPSTPNIGHLYSYQLQAMYVDEDVTMTAYVTDASNDDPDAGTTLTGVSVTFTVADPSIAALTTPATVTTSVIQTYGKAVAEAHLHTLKAGITEVTATVAGQTGAGGIQLFTSFHVHVGVPARIVFVPSILSIEAQTVSAPLAAYIQTVAGDTLFGKPLKWSCPQGESIAQMMNVQVECGGEGINVIVRPVRVGTTTMRAAMPDALFSRFPLSSDVNVFITAAISRMDLAAAGPFTVGTVTRMLPVFRDAAGNVLPTAISDKYGPLLDQVQYTSSDPTVLSFDATGNLTALRPGTVTVTADYYDLTKPLFSPPTFSTTASVTVIAPLGSFTLGVQTAPLNAAPGGQAADVVNITRSNFTGPVTITGTSDAGITVTGSGPTTAAQATIIVNVPAAAALGTHTVNLTATSSLNPVTTSFALVLQPLNTTWTFCPTSGLPLWVAVQDGAGAWTAVTGTSNAYAFTLASSTGGVAYVTQPGTTDLHIFYGTKAELQAMGTGLCVNPGATKTINGIVTNTGTAASAWIGLASALTSIPRPGTSAFQLTQVPPGTLDLAAATVDGVSPQPNGLKMIVRRNVNLADGGNTGSLDFSAAEAVVPTIKTLTPNLFDQGIRVTYGFLTTNQVLSNYYTNFTNTGPTLSVFGWPAANQLAGDLHYLKAQASSGTGSTTSNRIAGVGVATIVDMAITFGPVLSVPTISAIATTPYARLRAVVPVQPEYNKLFEVTYQQSAASNRNVFIQMTGGYVNGAANATMDIPDFTGVTGWTTTWGPLAGFLTHWIVTSSSWSGTGGIVFPPLSAGTTFNSATKQNDITP